MSLPTVMYSPPTPALSWKMCRKHPPPSRSQPRGQAPGHRVSFLLRTMMRKPSWVRVSFQIVLRFTDVLYCTIDRYKKKWDAPVYAFFKPDWDMTPVNGRACITFHCAADVCRMPHPYVRRYLDLARIDASTSNLRTHAARCFGEDALAAADKAKDANEVRKTAHTNGGVLSGQSITVAFARKGKGKVTYSTRPHTEAEAR